MLLSTHRCHAGDLLFSRYLLPGQGGTHTSIASAPGPRSASGGALFLLCTGRDVVGINWTGARDSELYRADCRAIRLGLQRRTTLATIKSDQVRAKAEANFKKEARAKEGAKAMMEYQANGRMIREKTERLKALRLAKEAADKARNG